MNKPGFIIRSISVVLSFVVLSTNCVFANTTESLFYARRQRTLQLAQAQQDLFAPGLTPSVPSLLKGIPARAGTVRSFLPARKTATRTIVHVMDIHQNTEAQQNIGLAIQTLIQNKTGLIALEGATGPIDLNGLRRFPHKDILRRTADLLLKTNTISGAVHGAWTANGSIPAIVGIDDAALYQANIDAYRASAPRMKQVSDRLAALDQRLQSESAKHLNPDLLEWNNMMRAHREDRVSTADYIRYLAARTPASPNVQKFLDAANLEAGINFSAVETERARLLRRLSSALNEKEMSRLYDLSMAYRLSAISHADFYEALRDICRKHGVDLIAYPAMNAYIRYVLLSDSINAEAMWAETKQMETDVTNTLAKTGIEKSFMTESNRVYLTSQLVRFALTTPEWESYKLLAVSSKPENSGLQPIAQSLKPFEDFYRLAEARNDAMASNLLKAMEKNHATTAVIVTGGFHAGGIDDILTKAGAGIVAFTPRITKLDATDGASQLSVFLQEKTPLDRLFDGDKLFLPKNPAPRRSLLTAATIMVGVGLGLAASNLEASTAYLRDTTPLTLVGAKAVNVEGGRAERLQLIRNLPDDAPREFVIDVPLPNNAGDDLQLPRMVEEPRNLATLWGPILMIGSWLSLSRLSGLFGSRSGKKKTPLVPEEPVDKKFSVNLTGSTPGDLPSVTNAIQEMIKPHDRIPLTNNDNAAISRFIDEVVVEAIGQYSETGTGLAAKLQKDEAKCVVSRSIKKVSDSDHVVFEILTPVENAEYPRSKMSGYPFSINSRTDGKIGRTVSLSIPLPKRNESYLQTPVSSQNMWEQAAEANATVEEDSDEFSALITDIRFRLANHADQLKIEDLCYFLLINDADVAGTALALLAQRNDFSERTIPFLSVALESKTAPNPERRLDILPRLMRQWATQAPAGTKVDLHFQRAFQRPLNETQSGKAFANTGFQFTGQAGLVYTLEKNGSSMTSPDGTSANSPWSLLKFAWYLSFISGNVAIFSWTDDTPGHIVLGSGLDRWVKIDWDQTTPGETVAMQGQSRNALTWLHISAPVMWVFFSLFFLGLFAMAPVTALGINHIQNLGAVSPLALVFWFFVPGVLIGIPLNIRMTKQPVVPTLIAWILQSVLVGAILWWFPHHVGVTEILPLLAHPWQPFFWFVGVGALLTVALNLCGFILYLITHDQRLDSVDLVRAWIVHLGSPSKVDLRFSKPMTSAGSPWYQIPAVATVVRDLLVSGWLKTTAALTIFWKLVSSPWREKPAKRLIGDLLSSGYGVEKPLWPGRPAKPVSVKRVKSTIAPYQDRAKRDLANWVKGIKEGHAIQSLPELAALYPKESFQTLLNDSHNEGAWAEAKRRMGDPDDTFIGAEFPDDSFIEFLRPEFQQGYRQRTDKPTDKPFEAYLVTVGMLEPTKVVELYTKLGKSSKAIDKVVDIIATYGTRKEPSDKWPIIIDEFARPWVLYHSEALTQSSLLSLVSENGPYFNRQKDFFAAVGKRQTEIVGLVLGLNNLIQGSEEIDDPQFKNTALNNKGYLLWAFMSISGTLQEETGVRVFPEQGRWKRADGRTNHLIDRYIRQRHAIETGLPRLTSASSPYLALGAYLSNLLSRIHLPSFQFPRWQRKPNTDPNINPTAETINKLTVQQPRVVSVQPGGNAGKAARGVSAYSPADAPELPPTNSDRVMAASNGDVNNNEAAQTLSNAASRADGDGRSTKFESAGSAAGEIDGEATERANAAAQGNTRSKQQPTTTVSNRSQDQTSPTSASSANNVAAPMNATESAIAAQTDSHTNLNNTANRGSRGSQRADAQQNKIRPLSSSASQSRRESRTMPTVATPAGRVPNIGSARTIPLLLRPVSPAGSRGVTTVFGAAFLGSLVLEGILLLNGAADLAGSTLAFDVMKELSMGIHFMTGGMAAGVTIALAIQALRLNLGSTLTLLAASLPLTNLSDSSPANRPSRPIFQSAQPLNESIGSRFSRLTDNMFTTSLSDRVDTLLNNNLQFVPQSVATFRALELVRPISANASAAAAKSASQNAPATNIQTHLTNAYQRSVIGGIAYGVSALSQQTSSTPRQVLQRLGGSNANANEKAFILQLIGAIQRAAIHQLHLNGNDPIEAIENAQDNREELIAQLQQRPDWADVAKFIHRIDSAIAEQQNGKHVRSKNQGEIQRGHILKLLQDDLALKRFLAGLEDDAADKYGVKVLRLDPTSNKTRSKNEAKPTNSKEKAGQGDDESQRNAEDDVTALVIGVSAAAEASAEQDETPVDALKSYANETGTPKQGRFIEDFTAATVQGAAFTLGRPQTSVIADVNALTSPRASNSSQHASVRVGAELLVDVLDKQTAGVREGVSSFIASPFSFLSNNDNAADKSSTDDSISLGDRVKRIFSSETQTDSTGNVASLSDEALGRVADQLLALTELARANRAPGADVNLSALLPKAGAIGANDEHHLDAIVGLTTADFNRLQTILKDKIEQGAAHGRLNFAQAQELIADGVSARATAADTKRQLPNKDLFLPIEVANEESIDALLEWMEPGRVLYVPAALPAKYDELVAQGRIKVVSAGVSFTSERDGHKFLSLAAVALGLSAIVGLSLKNVVVLIPNGTNWDKTGLEEGNGLQAILEQVAFLRLQAFVTGIPLQFSDLEHIDLLAETLSDKHV